MISIVYCTKCRRLTCYAKCYYAECRYAECRSAKFATEVSEQKLNGNICFLMQHRHLLKLMTATDKHY
jgi:hypothetical protein